MKGIYLRTLTFKKSVIYLIKVNYTPYNYTPCNSTWTSLLSRDMRIASAYLDLCYTSNHKSTSFFPRFFSWVLCYSNLESLIFGLSHYPLEQKELSPVLYTVSLQTTFRNMNSAIWAVGQ